MFTEYEYYSLVCVSLEYKYATMKCVILRLFAIVQDVICARE